MSDDKHNEIHRYEHSGIEERVGKVPVWLIVVYVALSVWAIYYLWTYWYHA
jgi:hypothetical protein